LRFEYSKVKKKANINDMPAVEKYMNEIEQLRKKLVIENNLIK
jgi:hypothetical protein